MAIFRMARQPAFPQTITCQLQLGLGAFRLARCAAPARVLRDDGKRQRFGQRQLGGPFVKMNQARRTDPLDVTAVRRQVEVGLDDLVLAVARFQP